MACYMGNGIYNGSRIRRAVPAYNKPRIAIKRTMPSQHRPLLNISSVKCPERKLRSRYGQYKSLSALVRGISQRRRRSAVSASAERYPVHGIIAHSAVAPMHTPGDVRSVSYISALVCSLLNSFPFSYLSAAPARRPVSARQLQAKPYRIFLFETQYRKRRNMIISYRAA